MRNALIPIEIVEVTQWICNRYEIYYQINSEDIRHCTCFAEFEDKKNTYPDWLVSVPVNVAKAVLNNIKLRDSY